VRAPSGAVCSLDPSAPNGSRERVLLDHGAHAGDLREAQRSIPNRFIFL
jgi:hypothetical protein